MIFGKLWDFLCGTLVQPYDAISRPTKWTIPLLLTGLGTISMVASFSLPAASMESLRLVETDPVKYTDVGSGGSLFIASILFACLCGFVHPIYWVYSAMNILFFPLAVATLPRPSFRFLRRTGYLFCSLPAWLLPESEQWNDMLAGGCGGFRFCSSVRGDFGHCFLAGKNLRGFTTNHFLGYQDFVTLRSNNLQDTSNLVRRRWVRSGLSDVLTARQRFVQI